MEMSRDLPPGQHPQFDNYPTSQNPQPYPPTQPPPGYDAHQHPHTEPQSVQVVIQKQPQAVVASRSSDSGAQSFFGVSVTCLVLSIVCCAWPLLVCTIPALILSNKSKDSNTQGNLEAAKSYGRLACGLNILALIVFIIAVIFVIAFGSVEFTVESG